MRVNDLKLRLCLVVIAATFLLGCGGPATNNGSPGASGDGPPDLTDDVIRERINGVWVDGIPPIEGSGEPITWRFFESEPKEITVVDKKIDGNSASVVLDISTTSSPRSREKRYLTGQIRVQWQLNRGMVLRRWEVVDTENLTMKYKNLPPSSPSRAETEQDR